MIKLNAAARIKATKHISVLSTLIRKLVGPKVNAIPGREGFMVNESVDDVVWSFERGGWKETEVPNSSHPYAKVITRGGDVIGLKDLGDNKTGIGYFGW